MTDQLIKAISADGSIRAYFISATELVNEAVRIHHTSPTATAALGRLLCAAAMMGAMQKGERDQVDLQLKGGGPLGTVLAVADASARVKGYAQNPDVELPLNATGKLDVGGAVGRNGFLSVVKDIGLKEPFTGTVPLVSGEVGEDIALYFARSEQVPSVVALGVLVDVDGSCRAAGGYIVQLMPGAEESVISLLEKRVAGIAPVSTLVEAGKTPQQIMDLLLDGMSMELLEALHPEYCCDCSRQRVERALLSIGRADLESMIAEDGGAELTCHFCDQVYRFDRGQLEELLQKSDSRR